MKISELRQLIREEVREAINNENTSNSNDIKTNLKNNQTGKYIFLGDDQADLVYGKKYNQLTPLFYTNNTSATNNDLIKEATANKQLFTIVSIDNEGNIDIVTT